MSEWWQSARSNPLFRVMVVIAAGVVALDQATKLWILHGIRLAERPRGHIDLSPVFDLTYVENRGVSFGLFAGGITSRIALTLLALVVAGFVVHWAGRLDRRYGMIGAGLIVGGALGDAIDRAFYGYVVDFLDFASIGFPWRFNIADAAINIGVGFLAYDAFFVSPKSAPDASDAATASLADNDAKERGDREPFPATPPASIRPEEDNSRSSE